MKLHKIMSCFLAVSLALGSIAPIGQQTKAASLVKTGSLHETQQEKASSLVTMEEALAKRKEKERENQGTKSNVLARISSEASSYGKSGSLWINTEGETVEIPARKEKPTFSLLSQKEPLPDTYDLREVTKEGNSVVPSVRNQEAYGTCWAMAGLAAVESNVIMSGLSYRQNWLSNGELCFSTAHLAWHLFENSPEGDGIQGDYIERAYKGADGADYTGTIAALAANEGIQLEKNAPYANWNYGQSKESRYTSYYQLKDADYLDYAITQEAQSVVKQWIVNRGAVETGLYFSKMEKEECYYQNQYDELYGNHEVILIGWDDHYSKDNFTENGATPEYDGAWIAQNSYGTDWGDKGYFYISYEEPSLYGFISYQMTEQKDGEKCYQYDGAGGWLGVSSASFGGAANVFTATENEELTEIGISLSELNSSGANYKIQIYKWKEKQPEVVAQGMVNTGDLEKKKPIRISEETYVPEAETEGVMEYSGYHRIPLKTGVALEEGESYAVVLMLSPRDQHSIIYYSFEGSITGYDMDMFHYGFEEGQTYYLEGFGEQAEWKDITTIKKDRDGFELGNLNLKAFTYSVERTGEDSTLYQEQKAQLEETVNTVEEFLESLGIKIENKREEQSQQNSDEETAQEKKEFAFTEGNTSFNEELVSFLEEEYQFAKDTLSLEKLSIYEISNAYNSLIAAMGYMKYPAKMLITTADQLYELSAQTASLTMNALNLVSIESDLVMNPSKLFSFGRFDTEQDKTDKGVIQKVDGKAKTFSPIGGRGGVEFTLEGNGHTISGLVCSTKTSSGTAEAYSGLIGVLVGNGTIQNVVLKDSYVEGNLCVGAFAGALVYGGRIQSCTMRNTFVYGYGQVDEMIATRVAAEYVGGFAGIISEYNESRRSGIYDSKIRQCLIYGELLTGGIVGFVSSGAAAGTGNTISNSSVAGIVIYSSYHAGLGVYLGGETGNEKDIKNQEEIKKHYIIKNSSAKNKDILRISLYKPKNSANIDKVYLFIEPYQSFRTIKSILVQGSAEKKKRGKSYSEDGWRIKNMSGDITVVPMTKRIYQVNFYSSLTGKSISTQSIIRGEKAKRVKAPVISGYQFLGWYDKTTGERFRFTKKVKASYELFALYKKKKVS